MVKLACERPDRPEPTASKEGGEPEVDKGEARGENRIDAKVEPRRPRSRSLSQWDCKELAVQLVKDGIVDSISSQTVWRILRSHLLKPWRSHMWLTPDKPRDTEFYRRVQEISDLYTRELGPDEMVICVDEMTSLQPRPRPTPTRPAGSDNRPNLVEHHYWRAGALQLFAGFDTRTGKVYGDCYDRKRQEEFIRFLVMLDHELPESIRTIRIVLDNLRVHSGKKVREWLAAHPRFVFHFTPVHCSWMNQIEQWFSILRRKRLRIVDFDSKTDLRRKLLRFIEERNENAHPFNWSTKSVARIMAKAPLAEAA